MVQGSNRKATVVVIFPASFFVFFVFSILVSVQPIHSFETFAFNPKEVDKSLPEGGKICPLESKCDKQNENQTGTHNMTQNVPSTGKSDNGQDSIASSTVNESKGSQNETNLGNTTTLEGENKNSIQDMISMKTDKQLYNPGEKVTISINNTGSEQLTFPNSALGLTIRNLASNELYPILSSQVITILSPGDSKSLEWDQMGNDGNQAPSGNYTASVNSGINSAETTFSIK